jgi:phosphohistidine phosphatase SixA
VPLDSHGKEQAEQLAEHVAQLEPPIDRIYSCGEVYHNAFILSVILRLPSRYLRCIETVAAVVDKIKEARGKRVEVFGETGLVLVDSTTSSLYHVVTLASLQTSTEDGGA